MSESEEPVKRTGRWPLSIGTFLASFLLLALLLGWWADHQRLANELVDAKLDRELNLRQIQGLRKDRFDTRFQAFSSFSWETFESKWTPDTYVVAVEENRDRDALPALSNALFLSEEANLDAVVERLIPKVLSPSPQVRFNALATLVAQYSLHSSRMEKHTQKLTDVILVQLRESKDNVEEVKTVLDALNSIGANPSQAAIDEVAKIMNDDDHPLAVLATLTAGKMDVSLKVGPRLIDLIDQKHEDWALAAKHLHEHFPKAETYEYLKSKYREPKFGPNQLTLIEAMNEIEW